MRARRSAPITASLTTSPTRLRSRPGSQTSSPSRPNGPVSEPEGRTSLEGASGGFRSRASLLPNAQPPASTIEGIANGRHRLSVPHPGHRLDLSLSRSRATGRSGAPAAPALRRHPGPNRQRTRSEEHTSELQSLMRISYAVFCLKKKKKTTKHTRQTHDAGDSKNIKEEKNTR